MQYVVDFEDETELEAELNNPIPSFKYKSGRLMELGVSKDRARAVREVSTRTVTLVVLVKGSELKQV